MPGTGQQIASPGALGRLQPGAVILLNPMCRNEIGASLEEQGISARLVTQPEIPA